MQLPAIPQNAKRVAAQAVAHRLQDGHRSGGGDRGIDGVPAGLHHSQPGLRCLWVRGGDHIAGKHRGAR